MVPRTALRLVGREREVGALHEALARASRGEGARLASLVTLTGPVGVGKSALARRVAAELGQRGVFEEVEHLDASSATSSTTVPEVGEPAGDRRGPRRGGETRLLVIDGCDDGEAGRALVDRRLQEDPAAQLLVTARAPLRVEGEIVVELAPLATPSGDDPEGASFDCLATFLPEGALAALAARDRPALAALLRELDGLPLAMALAAPRLAVMEARVLLHRLQRSRSILERPDADATGRRPLETALASAMQALSPRAQAGLGALTSVVGAATLDALEAIVGPPSGAGDPRALDVIVELRERSLLVDGGAEGEPPRLAMLRCVRDVVARTASAAVLEDGRDRHAAHYADLAEALQRRAAAGDEAGARRALVADRSNFVAVLERVASSSSASPTSARRALRLLVAVYAVPGALPPATFLPLIDAAVDRTKDSGAEPVLIAQALLVRARASRAIGDSRSATRDLLRALHVALPTRRRDVEAEATSELAHLFAARGELEAAVDHARRASLAFRQTGDRAREAIAAAQVGDLERRRGDLAAARDALDRALPLASTSPGGIPAQVLDAAFRLHLEVQDAKELHATLALARPRPTSTEGDGRRVASLLLVEAVALHDQGEIVAARQRYAAATEAARQAGAPEVEAESALFDGVAALALGRRGEALARLRIAADLAGEGVLASHVAELAGAASFALDAWTTPSWRGAPPPAGASHFAQELVRGADAGRSYEALRAVLVEDGDVRVFARLFDRALGGSAPTTPGQDLDVARFDREGRWFRLPAEPMVSLERRRPLCAMVKLLVAERLARPGSPVTVPQLLAAGWGGERVQADAGAHRVRVALSTLRKLGLRSLLLTTPEGYSLDPARKVSTEGEVEG